MQQKNNKTTRPGDKGRPRGWASAVWPLEQPPRWTEQRDKTMQTTLRKWEWYEGAGGAE